MYNWQDPDWPRFRQDPALLADRLAATRHAQGRLLGSMEALGFEARSEAVLRTLTDDVVKTSEIEGELLSPDRVRSSIAVRLGLDAGGVPARDRDVDGIVDVTLDATRNHAAPLTEDRLFGWHAALFPTGRSGLRRICTGTWRDDADGPMQVISGPIGRRRVHYVAPPAERLEREMGAFLDWFENPGSMDPVLVAGLAHLWFVSIHPFDDGNGRIARAVADMALARSEGTAERFYSMSGQIRLERGATTTKGWRRPRRAGWMSRTGSSGFSDASTGRPQTPCMVLPPSCTRPASGTPMRPRASTSDRERP